MASKKQSSPKAAGKAKNAKNAGRKGRSVQVQQPKPWGLIITFSAVGVVALGLIAVAGFVVWDRSQPPSDVTNFYGEYESYSGVQDAIADGEVTEEDLEHPFVVQQTHVDGEGWDGTNPTYDLTPPAGGDHLSNWQNCTGVVYADPIVDGNAVHSLEHGAVWLTYDPELVDQDEIDELAAKVEGRDYSFMSPYPGQGAAVSLQAWGVQYQTDDVGDSNIGQFLNYYIQNGETAAEMNATCTRGVSTTVADANPGEMDQEGMEDAIEELEGATESESAPTEEEG